MQRYPCTTSVCPCMSTAVPLAARYKEQSCVSSAERAVRRLKESLSVIRAELNAGGADVVFTVEGLTDVLTYIGLTRNHFSNLQVPK